MHHYDCQILTRTCLDIYMSSLSLWSVTPSRRRPRIGMLSNLISVLLLGVLVSAQDLGVPLSWRVCRPFAASILSED